MNDIHKKSLLGSFFHQPPSALKNHSSPAHGPSLYQVLAETNWDGRALYQVLAETNRDGPLLYKVPPATNRDGRATPSQRTVPHPLTARSNSSTALNGRTGSAPSTLVVVGSDAPSP